MSAIGVGSRVVCIHRGVWTAPYGRVVNGPDAGSKWTVKQIDPAGLGIKLVGWPETRRWFHIRCFRLIEGDGEIARLSELIRDPVRIPEKADA